MRHSATPASTLLDLERIVVASVGVTARAHAMDASELTLLQWRALVLIDVPEGLAVGGLAAALGAKIAATSRLVGRLRDRGLVATERASDDARVVRVTLTGAGRELRARIVARRRLELQAALDGAGLPSGAASVVERLAELLEGIA
ncbi:MAG TPA: MarR family transcriptional regulator [Candidatus Limnocylindrales bacterium]|nr:MarR family transcriptional regulator [Candidatus Limnocylindrales bacterium]